MAKFIGPISMVADIFIAEQFTLSVGDLMHFVGFARIKSPNDIRNGIFHVFVYSTLENHLSEQSRQIEIE